MPNDTHEDIRRLLVEATADLPKLAPAPERTIRRARRRIVGTVGALALVVGVSISGVWIAAQPFGRTQPAAPRTPRGAWIVNVDTGVGSQLAGIPKGAFWFTASHDGSTIAFTANHGKDPASREQVYVMAADGTGLRRVTDEPYGASEPTLSPDGSQVAYKALRPYDDQGGQSRNVIVINTDGAGRPVQLTDERHDVASLAWSPTGDRILYSLAISGRPFVGGSWGSSKLKTVAVATGATMHLAGGSRTPTDFGAWSANGREVAYLTGREWTDEAYGFDPAEIWIVDSDGSFPHRVATLGGRAFELDWSPNGRSLAVSMEEGPTFGIYVLDVPTQEISRVTDGFFPVWLDAHTLIVQR